MCGLGGTLSLSRTFCFGPEKEVADDQADDQRDEEDRPIDFEEFHALRSSSSTGSPGA